MAPDTPRRDVKYLIDTPKSTPHSRPKKKNHDSAAKPSARKWSNFMQECRRWTPCPPTPVPPTKKEEGKNYTKKYKSEPEIAEPLGNGRTYVINRLNLGKTAHESDSDSE